MKLNELARSVGITKELDDKMFAAYGDIKDQSILFERDYLFEIQKKYSVFDGDVFCAVLSSYDDLLQKKDLMKWALLLKRILADWNNEEELYGTPFPERDGSPARDMIALFVLISLFESALSKYESYGFSREEALRELRALNKCVSRDADGKIYFSSTLFGWCAIYISASIFRYGALNFEVGRLCDPVSLLENKFTGERIAVMTDGRFHRSGLCLSNAALCDDGDGALFTDFEENKGEYIAYTVKNGYVMPERKSFLKSEWSILLSKGDKIVSLHIPRGVDVSRESVKKTVTEGMKIVRERYGEDIKFAYCRSWLLSPNIFDCLSPTSKIIEFSDCFERYPIESNGKELMPFLFGKSPENYAELPADTSLQRRVKELYLNGGFIYAGAGIITDKEFYV